MNRISTYRYICSASLCLGILFSGAPTWAKAFAWPTGIQLGIDVICPFQHQLYGSEEPQYALNAAIDVASCILEGDCGWGRIRWEGRNQTTNTLSSYTSDGRYFRLGLNYNLLQDTPDKNMAFLGFRYARSTFRDHLVSKVYYDSEGPIRGSNDAIDSRQDRVTANWFEATAGLKVKVWKLLYVGGTLRYKFGLRVDGAHSYAPYDIIGWGMHTHEKPLGFNLYLSLRIPFVRSTLPKSHPKR